MKCGYCEVVLVAQRMPMRLRYGGERGKWIPEDEHIFYVHPFLKPCARDAA